MGVTAGRDSELEKRPRLPRPEPSSLPHDPRDRPRRRRQARGERREARTCCSSDPRAWGPGLRLRGLPGPRSDRRGRGRPEHRAVWRGRDEQLRTSFNRQICPGASLVRGRSGSGKTPDRRPVLEHRSLSVDGHRRRGQGRVDCSTPGVFAAVLGTGDPHPRPDDGRAYDPLSYHNGSVWPHDTAICVWGPRPLRIHDRGGRARPRSTRRLRALRPLATGTLRRLLTIRRARSGPAPRRMLPQSWAATARPARPRCCASNRRRSAAMRDGTTHPAAPPSAQQRGLPWSSARHRGRCAWVVQHGRSTSRLSWPAYPPLVTNGGLIEDLQRCRHSLVSTTLKVWTVCPPARGRSHESTT